MLNNVPVTTTTSRAATRDESFFPINTSNVGHCNSSFSIFSWHLTLNGMYSTVSPVWHVAPLKQMYPCIMSNLCRLAFLVKTVLIIFNSYWSPLVLVSYSNNIPVSS